MNMSRRDFLKLIAAIFPLALLTKKLDNMFGNGGTLSAWSKSRSLSPWSGVIPRHIWYRVAEDDGQWHHHAMTWDGEKVTHYLDGEMVPDYTPYGHDGVSSWMNVYKDNIPVAHMSAYEEVLDQEEISRMSTLP